MRLHDWYKCEFCPEHHPVELAAYLTAMTNSTIEDLAMEMLRFPLLKRLLQTKDQRDLDQLYFRKFLSNMANVWRIQCITRNKEITSDDIEDWKAQEDIETSRVLEDCEIQSRNAAGFCHVVKCIKANQRICPGVLNKAFEGTLYHLLYRFTELFTCEPSEQWLEITDFNAHFKPLWFAGNRVYQFQTQIQWDMESDNRHDCMIMIDGELKKILTFDLQNDDVYCDHPDGPTRTKYENEILLWWQTNPDYFETAITELRLCYFVNSQRPRAWIRCPAVTNKDLPATTTIDLAPIYSSAADATLDALFGVKKLEARLMAMMDKKIDDNKKVMERLERL